MPSELEQLQIDIAARLESLAEFAAVPIYVIRPRDEGDALMIQTTIDEALAGLDTKAGKSGAAVLVSMPVCDAPESNVPGPQLEVTVQLRVIENPMVNMGADGTLLSAEQIGLNALRGLHHWNRRTNANPLAADRRALEPATVPGKVAYDVFLTTRLGIDPPARVRPPSYSASYSADSTTAPAVITLAAVTGGSSIYYTTDGSYPHAGNDNAELYSSPVTLATAGTLRAAAYKSGLQGSDAVEIQIS